MKSTFHASLGVLLVVLASSFANAQTTTCLGQDATICSGDQITINDCAGLGSGGSVVAYTMNQISYNPDPLITSNGVNLTDDEFSDVIDIGFDFCFYGNTYNQLLISSNNFLSFDLANALGFSTWMTVPIPDPTSTSEFNSIMGPWQDINPASGGVISYAVYGTAPNRRFVVTWNDIPMYNCGQLYSSQIKIFETTNKIETHILNKTICPGWNYGNAVHGVQAPLGASALTVPGRNNTQWQTNNEGYQFFPNQSFDWQDTDGNTYLYNAGSLTVTPVPVPSSDSIGYFLTSTDNCGNETVISDTSWITAVSATVTASAIDDICSASVGQVTATPLAGVPNYTYDWPALGEQTQTVTGLSAGTYTVNMTDGNGCTATAQVTVGETPVNFQGSTNVVSCSAGNDGTAFAEMVPSLGTITYQWDDPSMQTTQTATGLAAGQYNCTITSDIGCQGSVTLDISEPPPLSITFLTPDTQICPEDDITLLATASGGSTPYTFTWSENGNVIGTGTNITVESTFTNTQYCVELSEACGSPTASQCMLVHLPTPIEPIAIPDQPEKCMPGYFEFTNASTNAGEITTTYFDFGDGQFALENGTEITSHTYNKSDVFDMIMTVTSVYGCTYTDTLEQIVKVLPNPTASFTFSANPTTIFEPDVMCQNRSSQDVVDWQWYSPYSYPYQSGVTIPTFQFPQEPGTYPVTLIVTSEIGCTDTTTLYLTVVDGILFFAPNSFTPNNDEYNQVWKPEISGIDVYAYELLIFNRWGQVIWENHDPSVGWDGTHAGQNCKTGTYTWKAVVKNPYNDSKSEFRGSIQLLR